MKIIVGLGNPGKEYEQTRHNVGFQVIDLVAEDLNIEKFQLKEKFDSLIAEGNYRDEKIILVKPVTYMNLSGKAVSKLAKFYKVLFHDLWIIYDDLDFEIGNIKIREKGGPGSHKGMASIIASIGSENFPRVKIGIESRNEKQKAVKSGRGFVLGKFTKTEEKLINEAKIKAKDSIIYALENGITDAMNKYN
jgi:PTH1 family peptidyl-tRNA hydrolase